METPSSHFRSPTTHLSPSRLQELKDILGHSAITQEHYTMILQELYRSLKRESPVFPELKHQLQGFLATPKPLQLKAFIETKLIPEPSSSDLLRKKRRQTPRRRYTVRKNRVN